jgi:hypothetical protein
MMWEIEIQIGNSAHTYLGREIRGQRKAAMAPTDGAHSRNTE